jgi:hypothetical protein
VSTTNLRPVDLLGTCPVCGDERTLTAGLLPDHRVAGWQTNRPACTGAGRPPADAPHPDLFFPEGPHCWLAPAPQAREDGTR